MAGDAPPGIVWDDQPEPVAAGGGGGGAPPGIQFDDSPADSPPLPRTAASERDPNPLLDFLTSSVSAGSLVGAPRVLAFEDALRNPNRDGEGFLDHYARRRDEYLGGQQRMEERSPIATTAGKILNPQVLAGGVQALRAGTAAVAPTAWELAKQGGVQAGLSSLFQGDADVAGKGEVGKAVAQGLGGGALGAAAAGATALAVPAALGVGKKVLGAVGDMAGIAGDVGRVVAPFSRTARVAQAISRALGRFSSAEAEEVPVTMAQRVAALKTAKPDKFVNPFSSRYEPSAAAGIDPLAQGVPKAKTSISKLILAIRSAPGLLDQPEFGSFAQTLRGAMSRDQQAGGDENIRKADFILGNSDPDFQEFKKQLSEDDEP